MRLTRISYGRTVPGAEKFSSERFEVTIDVEEGEDPEAAYATAKEYVDLKLGGGGRQAAVAPDAPIDLNASFLADRKKTLQRAKEMLGAPMLTAEVVTGADWQTSSSFDDFCTTCSHRRGVHRVKSGDCTSPGCTCAGGMSAGMPGVVRPCKWCRHTLDDHSAASRCGFVGCACGQEAVVPPRKPDKRMSNLDIDDTGPPPGGANQDAQERNQVLTRLRNARIRTFLK